MYSENCSHFATHSFHCIFIIISVKKLSHFVSMEIVAILDVLAFTKVHNFKTASSSAVRSCTHIEDI